MKTSSPAQNEKSKCKDTVLLLNTLFSPLWQAVSVKQFLLYIESFSECCTITWIKVAAYIPGIGEQMVSVSSGITFLVVLRA